MTRSCVLRRIGDRDLYIGDWHAADPTTHDLTFDDVLTVCEREAPATTHHHALYDGPGNPHERVVEAIEKARELNAREGSLLIHCQGGISRSSTTIAATLAAEEGMRFRDAVRLVRSHRPDASPTPALRAHARLYLAELADALDVDSHCVDCETPIQNAPRQGSFDDSGNPIHADCADWII